MVWKNTVSMLSEVKNFILGAITPKDNSTDASAPEQQELVIGAEDKKATESGKITEKNYQDAGEFASEVYTEKKKEENSGSSLINKLFGTQNNDDTNSLKNEKSASQNKYSILQSFFKIFDTRTKYSDYNRTKSSSYTQSKSSFSTQSNRKTYTSPNIVTNFVNRITSGFSAIKNNFTDSSTMINLDSIDIDVLDLDSQDQDYDIDNQLFENESMEELFLAQGIIKENIKAEQEKSKLANNGENELIKNANDNYLESLDNYHQALNLSDNPAVIAAESQVLLINEKIYDQNSQINQLDTDISQANAQFYDCKKAFKNINDSLETCSNQISELKDLLNSGIDSESASELRSKFSELRKDEQKLKKEKLLAQENINSTQTQIDQLSAQKIKAKEVLQQYIDSRQEAQSQLDSITYQLIENAHNAMIESEKNFQNIVSKVEKNSDKKILFLEAQLAQVQKDKSNIQENIPDNLNDSNSDTTMQNNQSQGIDDLTQLNNDNAEFKSNILNTKVVEEALNANENLAIDNSSAAKSPYIIPLESQVKIEHTQDKIIFNNSDIEFTSDKISSLASAFDDNSTVLSELLSQKAKSSTQDITQLSEQQLTDFYNEQDKFKSKINKLIQEQEELNKKLNAEEKDYEDRQYQQEMLNKENNNTLENIEQEKNEEL